MRGRLPFILSIKHRTVSMLLIFSDVCDVMHTPMSAKYKRGDAIRLFLLFDALELLMVLKSSQEEIDDEEDFRNDINQESRIGYNQVNLQHTF